jgi:hypothetical protein
MERSHGIVIGSRIRLRARDIEALRTRLYRPAMRSKKTHVRDPPERLQDLQPRRASLSRGVGARARNVARPSRS